MLKDKIEYILLVIGEFAERFQMSVPMAYDYICEHRGMEIIDDGYAIEHTFSIEDAVDDVIRYCLKNGGQIA